MPVTSPIAATIDPVDPVVRASDYELSHRLDDDSMVGQVVKSMLDDVAGGSRVIVLRADDEVTPAQAASMIGVTRQFVDRLCADGVLAFHRLPGSRHRRIKVQDVVNIIAERETRRAGADALREVMNAAHG